MESEKIKKFLNEFIIISVYDSCYNLTVFIDGKMYTRYDRDSNGITHPLFEYVYEECGYLSREQLDKIAHDYNKSVIYCADGDIDILT
jgi:hypothetical protein